MWPDLWLSLEYGDVFVGERGLDILVGVSPVEGSESYASWRLGAK